MSIAKGLTICLLSILTAGCFSTAPRVVTTAAPDVDRIPVSIALHPLLTARTEKPLSYRTHHSARKGRELYLTPPASSELTVTLQSQLMTDLLSAELAYHGFALKELPFEAVETDGDDSAARGNFAISLDLLKELREEAGLQAVLVGNVYFERDTYTDSDYAVRAAHCKLIDIETLDILCHVSIPPADPGTGMESAVAAMASEMGRLAGLPAP